MLYIYVTNQKRGAEKTNIYKCDPDYFEYCLHIPTQRFTIINIFVNKKK